MNEFLARDALSAWELLREKGGIEPDGRDADLEEKLRRTLAPSAATLHEALKNSSTDALVIAFFDVVEPFVDMFRAILEFFEAAGARQGRAQWEIQIDNEHLDLSHFQRFQESWQSVTCAREIPAIDWKGAWAISHAARDLPGMESPLAFLDKNARINSGSDDIDHWLRAYRLGEYLPFPAVLHPDKVHPKVADAAAIAMAALDIIRRHWDARSTMIDEHSAGRYTIDRGDGLSPRSIAQNETDDWLGSSVIYLARYRLLSSDSREMFAQRLGEEYARYPRRKVGIKAEFSVLERILSLPVWQRRHELYAVWVATEIVNALPDHVCELHHEGGRITFAFHETVVATVRSSRPEVRLFAERRSPLSNPIGHGRTGNVQPDYGLWRGVGSRESCGLVIEVKHYKRDAPARFREVMVDYARAHREAKVVLVSHGPARETFYDVDTGVRDRCTALGELTTSHLEQREAFRKLVRDYVGDPVSEPNRPGLAEYTVIAIDISESMSTALESPEFGPFVQSLTNSGVREVALIDSEIRRVCTMEEVAGATRDTPRGGATHLDSPLEELLRGHARVLVVTDSDGVLGIANLAIEHVASETVGAAQVEILSVSRPVLGN